MLHLDIVLLLQISLVLVTNFSSNESSMHRIIEYGPHWVSVSWRLVKSRIHKNTSHKTFSLIDYDFIKWLHGDDDSRWPVANYSYVFTKHRQAAVLLQLLTLRDLHAKSVRSIKYIAVCEQKTTNINIIKTNSGTCFMCE